jgi:hypothetical protein
MYATVLHLDYASMYATAPNMNHASCNAYAISSERIWRHPRQIAISTLSFLVTSDMFTQRYHALRVPPFPGDS